MGIDIERYQIQGLKNRKEAISLGLDEDFGTKIIALVYFERGREHDGHVVGGVNRFCRDVGAGR